MPSPAQQNSPILCEKSSPSALSIKGINRRFGDVYANKDINIELSPGTIAGLLGPNGAGKTTLLRICCGWLKPDAGTVLIDGFEQGGRGKMARRRLGVVTQDAPVYQDLTVKEALGWYAALFGLSRSCCKEAVDRVIQEYRLSTFLNRRISVLSTGMKQCAQLACMMLHEPAVLLMDEPTAGLDPDMRLQLRRLLAVASRNGTAVLISTHQVDDAVSLCDEIYFMYKGQRTGYCTREEIGGDLAWLMSAYHRASGKGLQGTQG